MLYFAYGSNLCADRLRSRASSARFVDTGFLPGHALRFHKRGRDGSAKADAFPTGNPTDRVWGALAEVAPDDWASLDRSEPAYSRVSVGVRATTGGVRPALTYLAEVDAIDPDLRPRDWYVDLVAKGAEARGLPREYVDTIHQVETIPGTITETYDC